MRALPRLAIHFSIQAMKKTKNSPPAKAGAMTQERDDVLADRLVALAGDLRNSDVYAVLTDNLQKAQSELRKTIRKCLQQQREVVLDEALERTLEEDAKAYRVLRENIEEMSGTVVFRREEVPDLEVNAFVIPMFVHTTGGLRSEQCFQDEDAFEQLRDSIKDSGLESKKATVALVSHAYHPEEIKEVAYCQLNAMVLEAYDAMTRKKTTQADAIARSMRGWPASDFAPDDHAVELRFLLGFSLKTMDDPFYQVPVKEAAADRYFEARGERFRKWSQQVMPLLRRCLVTDGREVQIDFLYQDLFYGGKEAAFAEMDMLELLSEVQHALAEHGKTSEDAKAIVGPLAASDDAMLQLGLYDKTTDALIDVIERPLSPTEIAESVIADIADGLSTTGIQDIRIARHFDAEGNPDGVRPYSPR
ncbi:hypothetical protein ASE07_26070 [Noviherbaspirillum sp. Root189]|nr:hypothetical protein ASE07_26070 [Noviherbaspirillum sp. Root189]